MSSTPRHPHLRSAAPPCDKVVLGERAFRVSRARRALDVTASGLLLLLVAPLLVVTTALIVLVDGRPIFYRQLRLGENGVPFLMTKLRTMRPSPDGAGVTAAGDPRITAIGRVLRRTSLDELPQLWHVLRGQMTLVGPRPESVHLAERYPASCRPILAARPGLTGPAQLTYRERSAVPPGGWTDVEEWYLNVLVPLRTEADLGYLKNPSIGRTLRYLVLTALFVVGLVDLQASDVPARRDDVPHLPALWTSRAGQEIGLPRCLPSVATVFSSGSRAVSNSSTARSALNRPEDGVSPRSTF